MLSIDWDYFVPEKPEWDFAHAENPFHILFIWSLRMGVISEFKTTGEEETFWESTGLKDKISKVIVSESHAMAFDLAENVDHIVIVDAHHDCWKEDSVMGIDEGKKVYCHNWLRVWLSKNKHNKATWVCPPSSMTNFPLPKDMKKRVKIVHEVPNLADMDVLKVHVCRSGGWTPPWTDKQFIKFVKDGTWKIVRVKTSQLNPLKQRWTEEYFRKNLEKELAVQNFLNEQLRKANKKEV